MTKEFQAQAISPDLPVNASSIDLATTSDRPQYSALLTGILPVDSGLAQWAPSMVWITRLKTLKQREAEFLLRLTQVIFSHQGMPDAINALAIKDLDDIVDEPTAKMFRNGFAALDQAADGNWLSATPQDQAATVQANAKLPLVMHVRRHCVAALYNNELAFKYFGYQGAAFCKLDQRRRGFEDLTWLPGSSLDSASSSTASTASMDPIAQA